MRSEPKYGLSIPSVKSLFHQGSSCVFQSLRLSHKSSGRKTFQMKEDSPLYQTAISGIYECCSGRQKSRTAFLFRLAF